MALGLLEEYYNTSNISVLSFTTSASLGTDISRSTLIHLLLFLNWKKIPKLFLGHKFFFICQIEGESFGFAIFTTNWLSCSRLLMTPRNFSWVPVLLDSCLCCYSLSLLGHPPHWALAAGSSAWGMAAGSRTKMPSCLWCYSYLKPVLLVLLCLQLNTKADFISSLFQDEKYSQY